MGNPRKKVKMVKVKKRRRRRIQQAAAEAGAAPKPKREVSIDTTDDEAEGSEEEMVGGLSKKEMRRVEFAVATGDASVADFRMILGKDAHPVAELLLKRHNKSSLHGADVRKAVARALEISDKPVPFIALGCVPLIKQVHVFLVDSFDHSMYKNHPTIFPELHAAFTQKQTVMMCAPHASNRIHATETALLHVPISASSEAERVKEEKRKAVRAEKRTGVKQKALPTASSGEHLPSDIPDYLTQSLLSESEFIEHGYPPYAMVDYRERQRMSRRLATMGVEKDEVLDCSQRLDLAGCDFMDLRREPHAPTTRLDLKDADIKTLKALGEECLPALYAMDCEMVTGSTYGANGQPGPMLARVSVVDKTGKTVYDEFVKPQCPVSDYLTQWSGITPELSKAATTTIKDVQEFFKSILVKDEFGITPVLMGHSLENDLHSCRVVYDRVLDTSVFYHHPSPGRKPGLRWLTDKFLDRSIQGGSEGHSSVEDAVATLDLALMKLRKGPSFGQRTSFSVPLATVIRRDTLPFDSRKSAANRTPEDEPEVRTRGGVYIDSARTLSAIPCGVRIPTYCDEEKKKDEEEEGTTESVTQEAVDDHALSLFHKALEMYPEERFFYTRVKDFHHALNMVDYAKVSPLYCGQAVKKIPGAVLDALKTADHALAAAVAAIPEDSLVFVAGRSADLRLLHKLQKAKSIALSKRVWSNKNEATLVKVVDRSRRATCLMKVTGAQTKQ